MRFDSATYGPPKFSQVTARYRGLGNGPLLFCYLLRERKIIYAMMLPPGWTGIRPGCGSGRVKHHQRAIPALAYSAILIT